MTMHTDMNRTKRGGRVMDHPWSRADLVQLTRYVQQADAYLSQANPVSTTWYTVLGTTLDVRITSISAAITWATTQPTPLEVRVTVDGVVNVFGKIAPATAVNHFGAVSPGVAETAQELAPTFTTAAAITGLILPFLLEGRSVKVEVRITWATTQPTPLVCRVKWAQRS